MLLLALTVTVAEGARLRQQYLEVSDAGGEHSASLHEGPSAQAQALARLPAGTQLKELGCVDVAAERWCRVQLTDGSDQRGWVDVIHLEPWSGRVARRQARRNAVEPLRYDDEGTVPCSAPDNKVSAQCTFHLVRDDGGVTLLLANPARNTKAPLRVVRLEADRLTTRDGSLIWRNPHAGGWLVSVDGDEYYLLSQELIAGPGRQAADRSPTTAGVE
jgi:hypothetical protein